MIRATLREDLESRLENKVFILFSEDEIRAELFRRDEFIRAREDRLKYPELQPSFH